MLAWLAVALVAAVVLAAVIAAVAVIVTVAVAVDSAVPVIDPLAILLFARSLRPICQASHDAPSLYSRRRSV